MKKMQIQDMMRKDLVNFKPYHAPHVDYDIKLDANENPFAHDKKLRKALEVFLEDKDNLTRYPDTDATALRKKIAKLHKLKEEQILCGVGSDQLIECIIKIFVDVDDIVLVPTPSFSMYELSTILNHGRIEKIALDKDFQYDIEKWLEKIEKIQPKLIFLCTPNNPTGTTLKKEDIHKVLEIANCPVVVDEAYIEFTGDSMVSSLAEYPGLIILRTFSKAYGLAGIRSGYAMASEEMIQAICVAKPPYNLSAISQFISMYVLEHKEVYEKMVKEIIEEREKLCTELEHSSVIEKVVKSSTNFLLIKFLDSTVVQVLKDNKILIRGYEKGSNLSGYGRITVGTKEENEKLRKVLQKMEKKLQKKEA